MGVGRDSKNIFAIAHEQENDMYILGNQSGQSTDEEDTPPSPTPPQHTSSRHRRLRSRPRSSSLEACLTGMYRRCGARQARRSAHIKHLLSLKLEEEESNDVITPTYTIHSTPFSQLLQEQHKMQAWNDFVNCSEEDQERILQMRTSALSLSSIREESDEDDDDDKNGNKKKSPSRSPKKSAKGSNQNEKRDGTSPRVPSDNEEDDNGNLDDSWEKVESPGVDKRTVHPSFSAEECFQRVDKNLRAILTRRHLPLGIVSQLEREVVEFFTDYPGSIYINRLSSSFERLLLHAVCQYLGLCCQSFEEGGQRRTHVENKNSTFVLPSLPLAQFLERS